MIHSILFVSIYAIIVSPLLVLGEETVIDLGYELSSDSLLWPIPGLKPFKLDVINEGFDGGSAPKWYSAFNFSSVEHISTHVDAPYHFANKGWKVDEIPVENLVAPAVVIDISSKVEREGASASLSAQDVLDWVDEYGTFPNNSVILVRTGWSKFYGKKTSDMYFGNGAGDGTFSFPGISLSAAQTMLGYKNISGIHIVGVGIDTASLDMGKSTIYEVHRELFKENIYGIENLHNLHLLPPVGIDLTVSPMKIKGGSGAPARVYARLSHNSGAMLTANFSIFLISMLVFSLKNYLL